MTTDELVKIQSEIKALSDDFNAYYADWQGAKVRFVKLTEKFTNVADPLQHEIPHAEVSAQQTDELVKIQSEIKVLSNDFNAYYADWKGAKVRFVNLTKTLTSSAAAPTQQENPQAEASAQPTKEHASTADDNQATEENESTRADDCIPVAEEIARESTSGAPEENEEVRATASVVPEENEPNSSAPPAPTPTPILPSASDVKKTKALEHSAVKKRKASNSSDSSAQKKMKPLSSSFANPIISSASDVKKTKAAEQAAVKKRKASAALNSSAAKKMKPMTSSLENPIDVVPVSSMP